MEPESGLVNGIPWTYHDALTLDDLSPGDRKRVLAWIRQNIHFSGSGETYSSYDLKHHMEHDIGLYSSNNQFKHAMLICGFEPVDYDELNWEYPVISDKNPYAVQKEKERIEKEQKHKQYLAKWSRERPIQPKAAEDNSVLILDDEQRILLDSDTARIIGTSPQTDRIAVVSPRLNMHIAEILVEDTGIIFFDSNKAAFCSVLEYCYQSSRLLQLMGSIGEAIIVHRCNDDRRINQKWLSIAKMTPISEENSEEADKYIAVGTGFKSTQKQHPRLYNPFDTQNDIIWIDDQENRVIRYELHGLVGSYAALQVKASTNGERYVLPDLLNRRYGVPLVYYPVNNDFSLIAQKAPYVQPGIDFIDVRDADKPAFDEFMYYWSLLSRLHQGSIKPYDIINEARSMPALKNGLYASTIHMTKASFAMY